MTGISGDAGDAAPHVTHPTGQADEDAADRAGWGDAPRPALPGHDVVTPGRQVGPYRLVERLGRGGMGEVWLAEDPTGAAGGAPRRVALKLLAPDLVGDPDARARFAREVEAARRVRGPAVAALLDADVDAAEPWLASAYVAGPTLADHVARHGALPGPALRALALALADALASIHAAGVVHRDLTPRNVVLGPDGPRVVDFGIAWYDGAAALTETGARMGTPAWMAPERLTHDEVTAAGDVWSWGAVVAFAGLGRPAVSGGSREVIVHRILRGEVDIAGLPAGLAPWVAAALSVAPAQRPEVADLVEAMAGGGPPPAAPLAGGPWDVTQPMHGPDVDPARAPDSTARIGPLPPGPATTPQTGAGTTPVPTPRGESRPSDRRTGGSDAGIDRTARWPAGGPPGDGGRGPEGPGRSLARGMPDVTARRRLLRWGSAVVIVAAAALVGALVSPLVAVIVTAVVLMAAVALRIGRERLPEGARPIPPTWSVALAGPVVLGVALAQVVGPVGAVGALVAVVVLFVVLGGDLG